MARRYAAKIYLLTYVPKLYAITDLTAVFNTRIVALPLAGIFQQAMRSQGGTFALLFLFFLDQIINLPGAYITAGRMIWTLARDDAMPFSKFVRKVDAKWRNPFNAQIISGTYITLNPKCWVKVAATARSTPALSQIFELETLFSLF